MKKSPLKYWGLFSFFNIPELCASWDETGHWTSSLDLEDK